MPAPLPAVELETLGIGRVLVVGAHPDDCEFSAGGTLARLVELGAQVTLAVCSDGRRGGRELRNVGELRQREQDRAAKQLGVQRVERLGRVDGEVVCDEALRADLVRLIRRHRPELVLTHDPRTLWRRFGHTTFLGHTDHRATGQAVLDAVYPRSGNPNFFPEQLDEPDLELAEPAQLWLFDTAEPDARVDVATTLAKKLAALREHESQARVAGGLVRAAESVARRLGRELGEGAEVPCEPFVVHRLRGAPR